jgi:nickel-type superoxide dismutase maturation protease
MTWKAACPAVAVIAAVLAALAMRRLGFRRAVVVGESMLPAFEPGDRVVLGPTGRLRAGQVVGLADPRDQTRLLIKRVHAMYGSTVDVRGDNEGASTDSRLFGPIPRSEVAGRVLYRYAPPGRARWMPQ